MPILWFNDKSHAWEQRWQLCQAKAINTGNSISTILSGMIGFQVVVNRQFAALRHCSQSMADPVIQHLSSLRQLSHQSVFLKPISEKKSPLSFSLSTLNLLFCLVNSSGQLSCDDWICILQNTQYIDYNAQLATWQNSFAQVVSSQTLYAHHDNTSRRNTTTHLSDTADFWPLQIS